ncbi:MAG: zinc-ribbon domain-containing protein [Deltaproteobacteria bacterium]|nr:zinc-ribbon domain-containing protein [Deltaproteobacteria bacterium]
MEVLCDRCKTEYDFDDALVSERGTTVKCTNCGHQFRIFRPKAAAAPPERWEVRTRKGQEFVFTSLRELQRAISRAQIDRDDVLVRDGLAPRMLSSIAELEPFFPSTVNRIPTPLPPRPEGPPRERKHTPKGLGTAPVESRALPFQTTMPVFPAAAPQPGEPPTAKASNPQTKPGLPPVTPPTPAPAPVTRMSGSGTAILGDEPPFEPETTRRPNLTPPPPQVAGSTVPLGSASPVAAVSPPARKLPPVEPTLNSAGSLPADKLEAPADVLIREKHDLSYTPTPSDIRAVYASPEDARTDPRYVVPARKGSAAVRWLFAFVVIGALIVVGAAVGRKYLRPAAGGPAAVASIDPRAAEFLRQGERLLLDGDLEGAKESFDKASALADRDVRVRVQLARWANAKADLPWLKLKLLAQDQTDAIVLARKEAEESSKRALQLSQSAMDVAPSDPAVLRARVDAYRIAGDLASARKLVAQLPSQGADPEGVYVLAALDMSEQNPNWANVIDRLRQAVAGEQSLGRARGALVYALASAGQVEAAQVEIDALFKAQRPYPLLVEARAFVARTPARKDGGALAMSEGGIDTSSLPLAQGGGALPEGETLPGNYQDLLQRAHAARASGDLDKAEQLYRSVLAKNPGDTEALSGLGDIAKARGDQNGSLSYYEQVQKQNPSYIPALVGMADAKWEAGDKQGAVALYRQVLDKTSGQGPYADRARQRIAAAAQGGAAPTATPTSTASAPPKPTATSTGTTTGPPPGVDTSDLPGWKPPQ